MKILMHVYIIALMFYTYALRVYLLIYVTLLVTFLRVILGQTIMTLKDAIFQAFFPLRDDAESLAMNTSVNINHYAFVLAFFDGGPDHNISFLNVTTSWLGYFILGKCDFLIVARTTPTQS